MTERRFFTKRMAVMWLSAVLTINMLPLTALADEKDVSQTHKAGAFRDTGEEVPGYTYEDEHTESVAEEPDGYVEVGNWNDLQVKLNEASTDRNNPTKIRLSDDLKAEENDIALTPAQNTFVELDLNGHTIDRGLAGKEAKNDGYVISVGLASLTISDSSEGGTGTITGGNNTEYGGGVYVGSSGNGFKMTGGSIKGNSAREGGGIYSETSCYISGVSRIEGNNCTSGNGGGVNSYVKGVYLQDKPIIQDNCKNGTWDSTKGIYTGTSKDNVYLSNGILGKTMIFLRAALTSGASIGLTLDTPRAFTQHWSSKMGNADPADFFTSDDSQYSVATTLEGEAILIAHTHEFSYTADGSTITATCGNSDGICPLTDHKASITIKAPEELVYDGAEKKATVEGSVPGVATPAISYKQGDTALEKGAPVNAGSYTASMTVEEKTASVNFTVSPRPVTISGVSAAEKVYDGTTDAEVTGTAALNGVIEDDKGEVTLVPGKVAFADPDAGNEKKVIFSGWSITGGRASNYELTLPQDVTASIKKAAQSDVAVQGSAEYGAEGMVDLKDSIKPGGKPGTVSISSDEASILDGTPVIKDGTGLVFKFKDAAENIGKKAAVAVSVTDATNYEDYKIVATLEVTGCGHEHKTLIEGTEKAATCTEQGYTGDYECPDCHSRLKGESTPIDPENHNFEKVEVVKPATATTMGETKYRCSRCQTEKIVADIPCVDTFAGAEYEDLWKDVEGLSGDASLVVENVKDDKGNVIGEIVKIGGKEVSKIVRDPESGKESVVSKVWIAGLQKKYTYTANYIKPVIRVYDGTRKLKEKTDYTLEYKNNKKVGTDAQIIVKFKGAYAYSGSVKAGFEIVKATLGKDILAFDASAISENKIRKTEPLLIWADTGQKASAKYFRFDYGDVVDNECVVTITPNPSYDTSFDGMITAKVKYVSDKMLSISNAKVHFDSSSYVYTGQEIMPSYTVRIGTVTLVKDTDYTATVQNAVYPGTATIRIEAKPGNAKGYFGSMTDTFKIKGGKIIEDAEPFSIEVQKSVPFAMGRAKAAVVVKDGTKVLKEGVDYSLSYTRNKDVTSGETAQVCIKGKGNYKGKVTKTFAITKQQLSALSQNIIVSDQFTTKRKLKKPKVTINDLDGKILKVNKDYAIDKVDADDPANTDESGTVKVTIRGMGSAYEGTFETTFRYVKKEADISKAKAAKKIAEQTYTGRPVTLSNEDLKGILTVNSVPLEPGKDFVIESYKNNTSKGTAKVTVVGIGTMAGRKTISFRIVHKPVDYMGTMN